MLSTLLFVLLLFFIYFAASSPHPSPLHPFSCLSFFHAASIVVFSLSFSFFPHFLYILLYPPSRFTHPSSLFPFLPFHINCSRQIFFFLLLSSSFMFSHLSDLFSVLLFSCSLFLFMFCCLTDLTVLQLSTPFFNLFTFSPSSFLSLSFFSFCISFSSQLHFIPLLLSTHLSL